MPTQPSFIIVADRGSVKAYDIEQTPARRLTTRLVETLRVEEAHGRYEDKVTDQAGGFPAGGTGGQGNAIAERMTLESENEMRSFRHVAEHMTKLLEERRPERWGFAAPSEINGAILDGLAPELRARLVRNVRSDLTNTPADELLSHFEKAN